MSEGPSAPRAEADAVVSGDGTGAGGRPPTVVIRCAWGLEAGGGHLYRCMALARWLGRGRRWRVVVAGLEPVPRFADVVAAWLPAAAGPDAVADAAGPVDLVVVDDYAADVRLETAWRSVAGRIVVIDDLANRHHDCDLLIDSGADEDAGDYGALVGPGCRLLLGPRYALIDPAYARWRPRSLGRSSAAEPARRVLVSFGLTDLGGYALRTTRVLVDRTDLHVTVAISARSPSAAELASLAAMLPDRVRVVFDCDDMAALLTDCDLAVGSAGGTAWERCALGVPAVATVVADNQRRFARGIGDAGAAIVVDGTAADFAARMADAVARCRDSALRADMATAAARLCDGLGGGRIALALDPERTACGLPVTLRPLVPSDMELLYACQHRPETRRFANNPRPPTRPEHAAWFQRTLDDPGAVPSVIVCDQQDCGAVSLAWRDELDGYLVSIYLVPEMFGRGIGTAALRAVHRLVPADRFLAEVLPGNASSHRLFARTGYRPVGGTLYEREAR